MQEHQNTFFLPSNNQEFKKTESLLADKNQKLLAPWRLKGKGFAFYYQFDKNFILDKTFLPNNFKSSGFGTMGVVMLINYTDSPVGEFNELLIAPAKFDTSGIRKYYISKSYVDSKEAMAAGRKNWGIPREMARFDWKENGDITNIKVFKEEFEFFDISIRTGTYHIPINTTLFPINLYQEIDGEGFHVNPGGKGVGKPARIIEGHAEEELFPNIFDYRTSMAIKVDPFNFLFPEAL